MLRPDFEADISGSREGSQSPTTRKRKKVSQRRKSLAESNNLLGRYKYFLVYFIQNAIISILIFSDNHDQHSNSSSHSNNQQTLSTSAATSASNNMSVTNNKNKTEQDANQDHNDNGPTDDEVTHQAKRTKHADGAMDNKLESEIMIEPKNEYDDDDDDDGDENVEDLTMDDLEELDQPGPSHAGEGSSQGMKYDKPLSLHILYINIHLIGYHWQMDSRSQEGQDSTGHHRDAQGRTNF